MQQVVAANGVQENERGDAQEATKARDANWMNWINGWPTTKPSPTSPCRTRRNCWKSWVGL